jgi:signal transduction histidine kinase/CheY-like chemotaxis protein
MRLGAVILVAFLIVFALRPIHGVGAANPWRIPLHLLSIIDSAALLALTFSKWMPRFWRPIELTTCAVCLLAMTGLAVIYREPEPLGIVIMGILVTDGAVLPWGSKWQAALSAVGLGCFSLFALLTPASVHPTNIQWISLGAAVALGQTFAALMADQRRELGERMIALQESQARLRGEIVQRERALREREKTAGELISAREAALAASRAKSEFLSSMSHEIRTPLNALLGMADLLAETRLDELQSHYMEGLIGNGNALLELINSILDLSRIESGRLSLENIPFDLQQVVERCVETFAARAHGKDLSMKVTIGPDVPRKLIGDSLRLRQILINLIGNAIKFTPSGGVEVRVERDVASNRPAALRFSVVDTGIGIAPDKMPTIFSAFTQADSSTTRKYGGSGLGLAIVQRLVVLMNGRAWVHSTPGHGSTFYFTAVFAMQPAAAESPPSGPASLQSANHSLMVDRPLRILLADDSVDNRLLVRHYLKGTQYLIDEAENGKIAIEKFLANDYDLVLMDIQMPEVDGYDATRAMRRWESERAQARTPILALTAAALEENIRSTREAGCDMHVTKPVKKNTLLAAIRSAVMHEPGAATVHPSDP